MFCTKCGSPNDDNSFRCTACGEKLRHFAARPQPQYVESHLVWAILVTIFCCLPFGIVSIVYAVNAQQAAALGNVEVAERNADKAMFWVKLSVALGIVGMVLWLVCFAVLGGLAHR